MPQDDMPQDDMPQDEMPRDNMQDMEKIIFHPQANFQGWKMSANINRS